MARGSASSARTAEARRRCCGRSLGSSRSTAEAAAHRLERLEQARVEKPWQPWDLRFALAPARRAGDLVVELDKAVVERGRFRLGPLDLCLSWGERLSIAGSNGSGKSTLLDVVLGRLPLASGTRRVGPSVVFGEIGQQRPRFDGSRPTIELFCSETGMSPGEARTLLAKFDLYADHVARAAGTLSPGERTRAELAVQAVLGANCLVLDEPTNHLDLPAIEELERALAGTRGR